MKMFAELQWMSGFVCEGSRPFITDGRLVDGHTGQFFDFLTVDNEQDDDVGVYGSVLAEMRADFLFKTSELAI